MDVSNAELKRASKRLRDKRRIIRAHVATRNVHDITTKSFWKEQMIGIIIGATGLTVFIAIAMLMGYIVGTYEVWSIMR
tara:strand:+ start:4719 stop:4955 length:237 start_codon:yes stop_codon:yes gene_type:complete